MKALGLGISASGTAAFVTQAIETFMLAQRTFLYLVAVRIQFPIASMIQNKLNVKHRLNLLLRRAKLFISISPSTPFVDTGG